MAVVKCSNNKTYITSKESTRIIGIDLLRIWMCFEVISAHFLVYNDNGIILLDFLDWNKQIAVGCFMFVSFLVTSPFLINWRNNTKKLFKRLNRLCIPIIVWAVIYFICFIAINKVFHGLEALTIKDFIWQLVTGHSYNKPMWFINNTLYITLLLLPVLAIRNKLLKTIILCLLIICSLVLQHTGINGYLFAHLNIELSYPLGRLLEQLPYASCAIIIVLWNLHNMMKSKWAIWIGIISTIALFSTYFINIPVKYSFGSAGVSLLLISISVALIFYLIPNYIFNIHCKRIIRFISSYTLGIYCLHNLMGATLLKMNIASNTFFLCIVIFICCLLSCWLMSLLPHKWIKEAVS